LVANKGRLTLLIKLVYDPLESIADIYRLAPILSASILSVLITIMYNGRSTSTSTGLFSDLHDLFTESLRDESRLKFFLRFILPNQLQQNFERTALPLVFLTAFLVPISIIVANLFTHREKMGRALRLEYTRLASVVLYNWSVAHLVVGIPALLFFNSRSAYYSGALMFAPLPYFGLLVILALRKIYNLTFGKAMVTTIVAIVALPMLLFGPMFLFSTVPFFILFWFVILIRGYAGEILSAHRARVRFEQSLVTATLNPADSSAHYNLGRIYQQRGQEAEAINCFNKALEINSDEIDAYYQLGRIARDQQRYSDAILAFDAVVQRDLNYSQQEVWREVGATYYAAGQYADASNALERFLRSRPSDAEGMYRYGLALFQLGRLDDAVTQMKDVIETVQNAPAFKYRIDRRWMIEAQSFLRSQTA